jgi:hypothetical protein
MKEEGQPIAAEVVYEGAYLFQGYHGARSVCYLRLYQPSGSPGSDVPPPVAIFTEVASNTGTSVTNRIEHLTLSAWEFLQKPEKPLIVIEHYPNRGWHNPSIDKWQFPETFKQVEFDRGEGGSFKAPRWERIEKQEVETLIGQTLETQQ